MRHCYRIDAQTAQGSFYDFHKIIEPLVNPSTPHSPAFVTLAMNDSEGRLTSR